jgi:hypothetical protein
MAGFGCPPRAVPATHLVRVTHPFHPLSGQQLVWIGERSNRSGRRLLLRTDDSCVWSVPEQWTDLAAPDPEVVLGAGRALCRLRDLVELARLVARLGGRGAEEAADGS